MKIEEAHALFMAQHLGQWVVCPEFETSEKFRLDGITIADININAAEFVTIPKYSLIITGDFSDGTCGFNQTGQCDMDASYLLLRSVQDLTDEEKIQCYHLHSGVIGYDYTQDFADVLTMTNHWLNHDGYQTLFRFACTVNYLRVIGILLPFTYLNDDNKPVTISPAALISMGWARVK